LGNKNGKIIGNLKKIKENSSFDFKKFLKRWFLKRIRVELNSVWKRIL